MMEEEGSVAILDISLSRSLLLRTTRMTGEGYAELMPLRRWCYYIVILCCSGHKRGRFHLESSARAGWKTQHN